VNDKAKKQRKIFTRGKHPGLPDALPRETGFRRGGWQGWAGILLVFLTLEIAILSIEQAHWINPQPSLSLVLFLSVVFALILTKIRLFGFIKFILALVIGLVVTAWQAMNVLMVPETTSRFSHFLDVVTSLWQESSVLLPGDDKIIYVVFITFITWIIGCLSLWFVLRRNNAWVAVCLGGLVVLFNLSNLPDTFYIYFFLYFLAAALLLAMTRMTGQSLKAGLIANYTGKSLLYLGISLLCITGLAASISWITPQVRATGLQDYIATKLPWQRDIMESKFNIFNIVPSKQAVSTAGTLKDLTFTNTWNQGYEIEYIVYSERPSYWRMNVYDTYTPQGWTNSPADKTLLEADTPWVEAEKFPDQEVMRYAVTTQIFTDVLLTNGGFISSDIPVRVNIGAGGDVEAVNAARILSPGEDYTVTSHVISAAESDLSGAGEQYPEFIKATYLQLPADIPDDIKLLSENITRNANTPYAKVTAIIGYLSGYSYKLVIDAPPEGADSVAYFLFTRQNGYCLHFASATVIMLRSIDVPSRLVVGYLPGEPGNIPGQYILRDKYYHAWPQVYFPGYGWVDIEATPGDSSSQISIDTPLVSSTALEQSEYWKYLWGGAAPPKIEDIANIDLRSMPGGIPDETDSLSFADKLGRALLFVFIAAVIIALLIGFILFVRALSFRWLWRVDRKALAYDAYVNMCKLASMVGFVPGPQQTPLEFADSLAKVFPQETEALGYITQAYLVTRFGGRRAKPALAEEAAILKARHIVYNTLLQRLGLTRRLFGKR
jgi:transglutaminase-like putative cysteine protease